MQVMMQHVAPRMQPIQILVHREIDILEAVDYAQRYLDGIFPEDVVNETQFGPQLGPDVELTGNMAGHSEEASQRGI